MTTQGKIIEAFWKIYNNSEEGCIDYNGLFSDYHIKVYADEEWYSPIAEVKLREHKQHRKKFFGILREEIIIESLDFDISDRENRVHHNVVSKDPEQIQKVKAIIDNRKKEQEEKERLKKEKSLDNLINKYA